MLETEEASDSHDEEIRGPVSGLCHRRLPGNRPHGWNMESSALEWKTVGVGCTGWTYRFNGDGIAGKRNVGNASLSIFRDLA